MSGKELLAALNALLNGTSAVLLILAYITIRRGAARAKVQMQPVAAHVAAGMAALDSDLAAEPVSHRTADSATNPYIRRHAQLMLSALATSAVFLVFYITSYVVYGDRSSGLPPGLFRTAYLLMLASHVLLAMVMLPMIGVTLWHAYRRNWVRHRRIARPTYWIWLYVSVTGVLIYLVLYHMVPAMYPAAQTAGA